jgi:hypothetical protein
LYLTEPILSGLQWEFSCILEVVEKRTAKNGQRKTGHLAEEKIVFRI